MNRSLLEKPFEPGQIRRRQGRNGLLDYVEGHSVIQRLNDALDGGWSFEITHHEVREDEVIVLGKLTAETTTKMAFGASQVARSRPHTRGTPTCRHGDDVVVDRVEPVAVPEVAAAMVCSGCAPGRPQGPGSLAVRLQVQLGEHVAGVVVERLPRERTPRALQLHEPLMRDLDVGLRRGPPIAVVSLALGTVVVGSLAVAPCTSSFMLT